MEASTFYWSAGCCFLAFGTMSPCCPCWPRTNCNPGLSLLSLASSPTLLLLLMCYFAAMRTQLLEASYMDWRIGLQESPKPSIVRSIAKRSLCPQISRETRNAKHRGLYFQWEKWKPSSSNQAGNWRWLKACWFALSVGPGFIKLLPPGLPKLPQPGPKTSTMSVGLKTCQGLPRALKLVQAAYL